MTYKPIDHAGYENWQIGAERFVVDLDRCEHGRHTGDACVWCPGDVSNGNPRMRGKDPRTEQGEQILGFSIGGIPYVLTSLENYDRYENSTIVQLRYSREKSSPSD